MTSMTTPTNLKAGELAWNKLTSEQYPEYDCECAVIAENGWVMLAHFSGGVFEHYDFETCGYYPVNVKYFIVLPDKPL